MGKEVGSVFRKVRSHQGFRCQTQDVYYTRIILAIVTVGRETKI